MSVITQQQYAQDIHLHDAIGVANKNNAMNINCLMMCEVVAVNENSYNVKALSLYLSTNNTAIDVPTSFNVPFCTEQAGNFGFILPPYSVGDYVLVGYMDRQVNNALRQEKAQPPTAIRNHDIADAIIIKGYSKSAPTTFIKINEDNSIEITATNVSVNASQVNLGNNANSNVLTKDSVIIDSIGKQCVIQTFSNTVKASM